MAVRAPKAEPVAPPVYAAEAEIHRASPAITPAPPVRAGWKRKAKTAFKRGLRHLFEAGQAAGINVLPRHFYSEIPSIRALRASEAWKRPHSMFGVQGADPPVQLEFVESCCPPDTVQRLARNDVFAQACAANGEPGFSAVDADFLFAFIRSIRPARIVQVGCGVSTAVMLHAADEAGYRPEVVCVEPYPTAFLRDAHAAGRIRLVAEPAQSVPLRTLTELGENGFLFVDSTHTVKPGSEVNRLILEVLPRLKPGDWVHFHDIYFPYNYQRGILDDELFFCNESALLHAFLVNNESFTIRASLSMIHDADPAQLGRALPNYRPARNDHGLRVSEGDFPGSIYLQVVDH